ncbi:MAG: DUF58 domain-containing protein [Deltaproteobacteria bacterium]|nr:DUF58 domain-containing protein [Deltaproteobacteria bacterium]MCX7952284.1 DUF58 domain-containing protein [Deltaproteobacteria bacterium]
MKISIKIDRSIISSLRRRQLQIDRRTRSLDLGLRRSLYKGYGLEFEDYREYTAGDSIKHIDWKVYGRTEKLYLKLFSEERRTVIAVVLDLSRSMFFSEEKISHAFNIAVGLSALALLNRDKVYLRLGERAFTFDQFNHLLTKFSMIQLEAGFKGFDQLSLENLPRDPSKVFVISDFFEELDTVRKNFSIISRKQFDICAIQILDKSELHPDFAKWSFVKDLENERELPVNKALEREYSKNLVNHIKTLKKLAFLYKIRFVSHSTNDDLANFFLKKLLKEKVLR